MTTNHELLEGDLPDISVVIPVYKAEHCLNELYSRLLASLSLISEKFEIILVEDCGGDNSWDMIERMSKIDARVKGIQFSRNFGQHYGISAGLDASIGNWVVVMDCDLQDRPEEIPALYTKAKEGFDIVLARRGRRKDSILKRFGSWIYYKLFSYLADIDYDGEVGNFRIMSRLVVDNYKRMGERLRFLGGLVQWLGFPTTSIDVVHSERFEGKSTYTFSKLLQLAIDTIIAHSDKPLRIAIRFGFTMACVSFVYGAYILWRAMVYGTPIAGWSSLIVSLYFIGGVIITILGILGIYIGKTFDETKKRPLYIIRRTTFNEPKGF